MVDQISEIADLISKVGFPIVCAALFIIIFIINYNKSSKNEEKKEETISNKDNEISKLVKTLQDQYEDTIEMLQEQNRHTVELIQSQNDSLVKEIVHGLSTHTMSDEETKKFSEIDEEVNNYLLRTQKVTNSDRVAVMLYHNGGNDALGNPFPRMSMRYEQCRAGVSRIMDNMKGMFKSYLHELCNIMDNKQYAEIPNIEDIKTVYPGLYDFLSERGVKSMFSIALRNKNGITNGFLFIEYYSLENVDIDQVRHCLHDKQLKIEALININR